MNLRELMDCKEWITGLDLEPDGENMDLMVYAQGVRHPHETKCYMLCSIMELVPKSLDPGPENKIPLTPEWQQKLMDSLWSAGVRPSKT